MKKWGVVIAAWLLAGCASSSDAPAARSEAEREERDGLIGEHVAPVPEPVDISIDAGERELGAYTLRLVFDRTLVRIVAIDSTPWFKPPDYNSQLFSSGEVTLAAYQTERGPRGRTVVARVTFESLGGVQSPLMVRLVTLVDPEARPIKGTSAASRDRVP
ncbi:MAG: hypothetical protein HYY18_01815 [Planctomycetes bacterium]|nr:hypothetical protein [Planctomycetota bacterium]